MKLLRLIAQELKQGKEAFRRFPLSMAFAIVAAIFQCIWLYRNEATVFNASPLLFSAVAVIGFFVTAAAYLYLESVREKENRGLTSLAFHANITFAVYLLKGYSVTAALRSPKPSVRVQILLPLPEKAP